AGVISFVGGLIPPTATQPLSPRQTTLPISPLQCHYTQELAVFICDSMFNLASSMLRDQAGTCLAMELLHQMVSNLSINAFACNFHLPNSKANQDVVEVNYLNTRIYKCLSVTKVEENMYGKPLFIQSS
ncbi:hypothetical protein FRC11_010122, partial [Ceratobasidium sp. 423]